MASLGFGTATLGREVDDDDSMRLLDAAFAMGIRHFDTAEAYGGGNARAYRKAVLNVDDVREASGAMHSSELILGRWIRSRGVRKEIAVATKVSSGFSVERVREALNGSMERLQVDHLDVYYLHSLPKDVPLSEPLGEMATARYTGQIRAIGVCNTDVAHLGETNRLAGGLGYCQNPLNLVQFEQSRESLAYCRAHGIAFVAYSPLAAGFLTGKYGLRGETRVKRTRFDVIPAHEAVYFTEDAFRTLARLDALSVKTGVPKHVLAMAWVLRQSDAALVLIGATRLEQLSNVDAAREVVLDEQAWDELLSDGQGSR